MRGFKLYAFLWTFIFLFLTGCTKNEVGQTDESKLQVYTSFYCIYDFVNKIGGDKIQLYNIVPTGTEPHNWEPTAGDMRKLSNADLLFYNGAGMENFVDSVKQSVENDKIKYIELSEGIELIKKNEESNIYDPHIWLNPINAEKEALKIKNALSEADSQNADFYNKNYEDFSKKAKELDKSFSDMVNNNENKTIVVAHEAYGYLCQAYGLKQLAIEGLSADSEPSPAKMAEVSEFIKNNKIKFIFFEELLAVKAADVISEETGAKLLVLNPFEGLSQEDIDNGEDYFSVMYKNLENIDKALKND